MFPVDFVSQMYFGELLIQKLLKKYLNTLSKVIEYLVGQEWGLWYILFSFNFYVNCVLPDDKTLTTETIPLFSQNVCMWQAGKA